MKLHETHPSTQSSVFFHVLLGKWLVGLQKWRPCDCVNDKTRQQRLADRPLGQPDTCEPARPM